MKKGLCCLMLLALSIAPVGGTVVSAKGESDNSFLSIGYNFYDEFDIHTQLQKNYLNDAVSTAPNYAQGISELSKPVPCTVSWNVDTNITTPDKKYVVALSEHPTMESAKTYIANTNSISFKNLKVGTKYYYTVSAMVNGVSYGSEIATFSTKNSLPRNIDVDGITNVRDLGGYTTSDGKKVRQGLVYRCGQLNERYIHNVVPLITNEGKDTMLNELGIKSEIDLRDTSDNEVSGIDYSILGREVNFYSGHLGWNVTNSYRNETEIIRDVFKIFAKRENYPIAFHCAIGTDRTGVIAFFLNSLLGVQENDLYRDYMFSNFGNIGSARGVESVQEHYKFLNALEGATLKDKAYNYFLGIGLTSGELDEIRNIMLIG